MKACPFCGHKAETTELRFYEQIKSCLFCPNPNCIMYNRAMTFEEWQSRPIEDALNKRIAELELMVVRLI